MDRFRGLGIKLLLLVLLVVLGWAAFTYEKVAYALIVVVFGFFGFYLSEIAKQAIRVRHVANQGWAYLLNVQYSVNLEPSFDWFHKVAQEWQTLRLTVDNAGYLASAVGIDFSEVDKKVRAQIKALVLEPKAFAAAKAEFATP